MAFSHPFLFFIQKRKLKFVNTMLPNVSQLLNSKTHVFWLLVQQLFQYVKQQFEEIERQKESKKKKESNKRGKTKRENMHLISTLRTFISQDLKLLLRSILNRQCFFTCHIIVASQQIWKLNHLYKKKNWKLRERK